MSQPQDILRRRGLEYHSHPDRGPSSGSIAVDFDLLLNGFVQVAADARLELSDKGRAFLAGAANA